MKRIQYTDHLKLRIKLRNIPNSLPRKIYLDADEKFYDQSTHHYVAIKAVKFLGKLREMIVSYDESEDIVEIITIHPIKKYQKVQRIKSGRWEKI